jgi:hypothetical protein
MSQLCELSDERNFSLKDYRPLVHDAMQFGTQKVSAAYLTKISGIIF